MVAAAVEPVAPPGKRASLIWLRRRFKVSAEAQGLSQEELRIKVISTDNADSLAFGPSLQAGGWRSLLTDGFAGPALL